jgi:hypothetical protein
MGVMMLQKPPRVGVHIHAILKIRKRTPDDLRGVIRLLKNDCVKIQNG